MSKTDDAKDVLIDSCVFAGTIKGCVGTNVGGILGGTDGVNDKLISNCLNLGTIESSKGNVGGIAGAVSKETVVMNCVNAGKIVSTDAKFDRVALVGAPASTATLDYSYFANIPGAKPYGSGSPANTGVLGIARKDMKGSNASKNMANLDFKAKWTAYKDGYPIPTGVIAMFDAHKKAIEEDAGNGGAVWKNEVGSTYTGKADTSWYKEDQKTFTLTTADQLYGMAKLVNDGKTTFAGVTIKLGADIVINKDDASKWHSETPGLRIWKPMGTSAAKHFAGTLDGQGHYISGLYVRVERDSGFICYAMNATVKNLGIVNSYFENYGREHSQGYLSAQVLGTFVGRAYGSTLQNLYSDARLITHADARSYNTGGIAGFAKSDGTQDKVKYGASLIEGCVFAGTITTNNKDDNLTGGILGGTDGSYATVKNCLFRGAISSKGKTVGGIAGKMEKTSVMEGCVSVGNVDKKIGLIGAVSTDTKVGGSYYVKASGYKAYGSGTPKTNKATGLTTAQMQGESAGTAMSGLDFKSGWTALKADYPIPTGVKALYAAHKKPIPTLGTETGGESDGESGEESGGESGGAHVAGTPDTSWYEEGKTSFTLTTADQLFGLAQLVNKGNSFKGVTINLGQNIVVNTGNSSTWGKTAPARQWVPIGKGWSYGFSGTFDGQNHYISGLYSKTKANSALFGFATNATIKNLALLNSYFEVPTATASNEILGSFVGKGCGIHLENLYSNAILEGGYKCVGGIAAYIHSVENGAERTCVIRNCVFDGTINNVAKERAGGIVGIDAKGGGTLIEDCLFSGSINTAAGNYIGGIIGRPEADTLINRCLVAGSISRASGKHSAISGWLPAPTKNAVNKLIEFKDCYYISEFYNAIYDGHNTKEVTLKQNVTAVTKEKAIGANALSNMSLLGKGWIARANSYPVPISAQLMAFISTNAGAPAISVQPSNSGYNTASDAVTSLAVTATSPDGGKLTYQWYVNSAKSNVGGTIIPGATQATYKPDLTGMVAGNEKYFYCVVTSTNTNMTGIQIVSTTSKVACVHLHKADTSSFTGHDATQHWAACTVSGCSAASGHAAHTGEEKTCSTCGFLKANYYEGGSDKTWYTNNTDASEYVLTTPAQLVGLRELVNGGTTNFEGKTIKLGANMVFNSGRAKDMFQADLDADKRYTWTPIGSSAANSFQGTLDGDGHFVSGLYNVKSRDNAFMCYTFNATIQDMAIINSYFENNDNGQVLASFVGRGYGLTLQRVYSDAILVCSKDYNTGGLVGFAKSNRKETHDYGIATIDSCVFAGTIYSDGGDTDKDNLVGGIVGSTDNSYAIISNNLFAGTIYSNDNYLGGIVGRVGTVCTENTLDGVKLGENIGSQVYNNVVAGVINKSDAGSSCGAVVGESNNSSYKVNGTTTKPKAEKKIHDNYFNSACGTKAVDTATNTTETNNNPLTQDQMKGEAALTNMPKLFEGQTPAWQVTDGYPIPVGVVIP